MIEKREIKAQIEGLLFAAGEEGLNLQEIGKILDLSKRDVRLILDEMEMEWKQEGRGIQIVQVAQTYQLATLPEHAPYLAKLAKAPRRSQLSRAALETLAIIAYRQPITRAEIEEIRGVKSDRVLTQLQRQDLIRELGRAEGVGRPRLFGTTQAFLQYFGLNHLDELPSVDGLFDWKEEEEERKNLFQRFGIEEEDPSDPTP